MYSESVLGVVAPCGAQEPQLERCVWPAPGGSAALMPS